MHRRMFVMSCLLLFATTQASADRRYAPRIGIGGVQFGVPYVDSFITVEGEQSTYKVLSRGDLANVHSDDGTQTNIGVRSLVKPRASLRDGTIKSDPKAVDADMQPVDGIRQDEVGPEGVGTTTLLERAEQANDRGDYRTAERLSSQVLWTDENNAEAYSVRATSRIGQGEQTRQTWLIRQGLVDIRRALDLRRQNGSVDKRDYLVWMVGVNQLAALQTDQAQARANAAVVDDFATSHMNRFPADLQGNVRQQRDFARGMLGRRIAVDEDLRNVTR